MNNFIKDGYVYLPGFLDKESCSQAAKTMLELRSSGILTKDNMCDNAYSIYAPEFGDTLLEDLLPHFEHVTGLKLLPTYSYARIYNNGDTLKPHKDRKSCEISATLTLTKNVSWPIYMAKEATDMNNAVALKDYDDKTIYVENPSAIDMQIGDAVLYQGTKMVHWRDAYSGSEQIQIFLHYVDASGDYTDYKYDTRSCLSQYNKYSYDAKLLRTQTIASMQGTNHFKRFVLEQCLLAAQKGQYFIQVALPSNINLIDVINTLQQKNLNVFTSSNSLIITWNL